jgi:hypothetical protein
LLDFLTAVLTPRPMALLLCRDVWIDFILRSTWLGLNTILARSFWTAASKANSIAQWFCIRDSFGQVARSPASMAATMNSAEGF